MGYNVGMRFRTGVLAGFALGYYFGAKAGRERYQQIEEYLTQMRSSTAVRQLVSRLGDLAETGVTRSRDSVDDMSHASSPYTSRGAHEHQADPTLN